MPRFDKRETDHGRGDTDTIPGRRAWIAPLARPRSTPLCGGCRASTDVSVSVTAGTMTVQHDETSDLTAIEKKVTGLGYTVSPLAGKARRLLSQAACCGHDHGDHSHADHDHQHGHDGP